MEMNAETLKTIQTVISRLANKYRFGYHSVEDLKQEAFIMAAEGLEKYDGKRPLENFLYIHVKNRLSNFKRDNYERLDKPCLKCPLNAYIKCEDKCTAYNEKEECQLYAKWVIRNQSKKNIMQPVDIGDSQVLSPSTVSEVEEEVEGTELSKLIDKHLSVEYRSDYLKMKAGHKIPKKRREIVQQAVLNILEENGYVR